MPVLLALVLLTGTVSVPAVSVAGTVSPSQVRMNANLRQALGNLPDGQKLSVIVTLLDQADLGEVQQPGLSRAERQYRVITALKHTAKEQGRLRQLLASPAYARRVGKLTPFWIFNGFALTATSDVIQEISAQPEVASVHLEQTYHAPVMTMTSAAPTSNLTQIHAPDMWALGFRGQGVVVANLDSGVDGTHPDLAASYRGGANSWKDFTNSPSPVPIDPFGHGTQTMSVMVGGDASGTSIGVAPDAKWIAARIFDAAGNASETWIHQAFQWVLDPDGKQNTADAPDVVNSSWTGDQYSPGCDLAFQADLVSLRAAGILPVFSAGNYGQYPDSSRYPANYPEAFAVGAVDSSDTIAYFSSRGPSSCDGSIYPEVVAPGVGIEAAQSGGGYNYVSGTSFSAPHVAGALALLLSAKSDLTVGQQVAALQNSAMDLGATGSDNIYGYGRLDVLKAYYSMYQVRITTSAFSVNENAGTASLTVTLNQVSASPVTVSFTANGGTATSGVDYLLPAPLLFSRGETQKTAQVTILDDTLAEPDETFTIGLTNPVNATLANPILGVTGTILDNDPQVGFALTQQSVSEAAGMAQVVISRLGGISFPNTISVDCSISGGTALADIDYHLQTTCHAEFATGESQKTIPISVYPDGHPDSDKTLILSLSNVQNARLDPRAAQTTLTIRNTDPWYLNLPWIAKP